MEEQVTRIYSLLDNLQESTHILQSVVNSNHQKLLSINKMTKMFFSPNDADLELQASDPTRVLSEIQKLRRAISIKDEEMATLKEERDDYLLEVEQLNDVLQLLSEDHVTIQNEMREKEVLQEQIIHLNELILDRNSIISQLQIENSRIRAEKHELLKEFAQAIQADEDASYSEIA